MKHTLIGYGKMGKEIEKVLLSRNHVVEKTIDSTDELILFPRTEGIAIDFSEPNAFRANYKLIAEKFKGAVIGTTGWKDIENEVIGYFKEKGCSLVYAGNFSMGVNIFFESVEKLSEQLSKLKIYDPYILELHHKEKKDSPSGTALTLSEIINKNFEREVPTASIRSGKIKGIHDVGFECETDKISIRHEAYSREGFATGAVLAAEWLDESPGIYSFRDLLRQKI